MGSSLKFFDLARFNQGFAAVGVFVKINIWKILYLYFKYLSIISIIILEKLNKIIKEYQELINNSDKSVVKFTKNEYIVHRFSIDNRRNYRYIEDNINVTLIKSKYSYDYKNYGKYYDDGLANNDSSIVIPVSEFVKEKTIESG